MARKLNGQTYEFVNIRDRGDGIIGMRAQIVVKDKDGQRHEFYLGDEQALPFFQGLGIDLKAVMGMRAGEAKGFLSYLDHMRRAAKMAELGNRAAIQKELKQAEDSARLAHRPFDMVKAQNIWNSAQAHA